MKGRGRRWAILAAATAVIAAIGMADAARGGNGEQRQDQRSGSARHRRRRGRSFVIYLGDQADVSAASSMTDQDARGRYVYNTLKQHAARTQAPIKAELDAQACRTSPTGPST